MEGVGSLNQVDGASVFDQVRKRIPSSCKGLFRVQSILDGRFHREVVLVHKFERMGNEDARNRDIEAVLRCGSLQVKTEHDVMTK